MPRNRTVQKFGWIRDLPDRRDLMWKAPRALIKDLPVSVDLSPEMPKIYNQSTASSCTAHSIVALCEYKELQEGHADIMPSRLFVYYNTRVIGGNVGYDSGATIRDSVKSVVAYGYPPEKLWPYVISKIKRKPPKQAYKEALLNKITKYERVDQAPSQIKARLAQGNPITFGFSVYESFMFDAVAESGIMPMPEPGEGVEGGHAVLLVGYDDKTEYYKARNSWGAEWGQKGNFFIPYAFLHDSHYCSDFWTITYVP